MRPYSIPESPPERDLLFEKYLPVPPPDISPPLRKFGSSRSRYEPSPRPQGNSRKDSTVIQKRSGRREEIQIPSEATKAGFDGDAVVDTTCDEASGSERMNATRVTGHNRDIDNSFVGRVAAFAREGRENKAPTQDGRRRQGKKKHKQNSNFIIDNDRNETKEQTVEPTPKITSSERLSPLSISGKRHRSYPSRTLDSKYMSSKTSISPVASPPLAPTTTVTIVSATYTFKTKYLEFTDPYAILVINGNRCGITSTAKKKLNPYWNQGFDVQVTEDSLLGVEIMDNNKMTRNDGLTCEDGRLGYMSIHIGDAFDLRLDQAQTYTGALTLFPGAYCNSPYPGLDSNSELGKVLLKFEKGSCEDSSMTGKPPNNRNDLLLDSNKEQRIHYENQWPPVSGDDQLLAFIHDDDPSISYDDRAAEPHPKTKHLPGGPGTVPSYGAGLNAFGNAGRTYSQASELGNYQRYADDLDYYQQKTISNEPSVRTYPPAPTAPKSDSAAKAKPGCHTLGALL